MTGQTYALKTDARRICTAIAVMLVWALALAPVGFVGSDAEAMSSLVSQSAQLPPNFKLELYASGLTTPRFVSFSPEGDLYVAEFGSTNSDMPLIRVGNIGYLLKPARKV